MGNFIGRGISTENSEISENKNVSATTTGPTVIIGDATVNCKVEETLTNEGKVTFQTDGKTSFKVGNINEHVNAKAIINKVNVTQT